MAIDPKTLIRLTHAKITALPGRDHPNSVIELHHEDFPFTLSFTERHTYGSAKTLTPTLSEESLGSVRTSFNLSLDQGHTAKQKANAFCDEHMKCPRKINLHTAHGSRYASVIEDWFRINETIYNYYTKMCNEISDDLDRATVVVDELKNQLPKTNNSHCQRQQHTIFENDIARLFVADKDGSLKMSIDCNILTKNQKLELFEKFQEWSDDLK